MPTTLGWGDFVSFSPSGRKVLLVAGMGRDNWHNKALTVCDVETTACRALPIGFFGHAYWPLTYAWSRT